MQLLVKYLGRSMPEGRPGGDRVPGHSCSGSHAAAFWAPRPGPRQGPPPPHLIVSVAQGPEVSKVQSITELSGL